MKEEKSVLDLFAERNHGISRRFFLQSCGAALAVASMPINLTKVFAADAFSRQPVHTMLTWTLDPRTTQTLAWTTSVTADKGILQYTDTNNYKKDGWKAAVSVQGNTEEFDTNEDYVKLHYATAQKLKPGTEYTYRVGYDSNWSQPQSFLTEADNRSEFKFLVFGDSQSGLPANPEYGPWKKTIENAYAANTDAAFFMNIGDLVEVGQDFSHWKKWYSAAENVLEKIPGMAVAGNHETYDVPKENHSTLPVYFKKQIHLPLNGPEELKGQVYSFDYGNVHFAVLDSQENEEGTYIENMLQKEADWLDRDLTSSKQLWKMVFFHKTPYYNKAERSNENVKRAFTPIIDKHHVDMVVNGHDHGYSRTYPIYNDEFVSSPDKGTVYLVTGRSGNKYYTDLSQKIWDAFFFDPQAEPNYVVMSVKGAQLVVSAYTQSGSCIDVYTIDKNRKTDTPCTVLPGKANYTRLAIWGNLLQTPLIPVSPQQIDNIWYLPLNSFIDFIGGDMDLRNSAIAISYKKDVISLQLDSSDAVVNNNTVSLAHPVKFVKDTPMIAADDLKPLLKFDNKYDALLNVLFLVR
ncbi:metallophosphoesterase [Pectinatus haikarae]|uniref:metallophosphoesterase n=1 Tax=Pectinatus haikarae TaxID=349096 RepID=UPI0018C4DDE7